jgi:hypothetical protein
MIPKSASGYTFLASKMGYGVKTQDAADWEMQSIAG